MTTLPARGTENEAARHCSRPVKGEEGGSLSTDRLDDYLSTRRQSEALAAPLEVEDQVVQSMPDASPTKWHLAHTTWFFETFLLIPFVAGYTPFDARYGYLFNSYYEGAGPRHAQGQRGMLTRPTVAEVLRYRAHVDAAMTGLLRQAERTIAVDGKASFDSLVQLGIHHEQQHQELLLTDILHAFWLNPLRPAYRQESPTMSRETAPQLGWIERDGGIHHIGHAGGGFAFDNETPRHAVLLRPFRIASRPVTIGEWRAFIDDDGYRRPELWLSDGWAAAQTQGWQAPLYWEPSDSAEEMRSMTLAGMQPLDDAQPVCHISYYEADAFARWSGKRLPTEAEWEVSAERLDAIGNTVGSGHLRPMPATATASTASGLTQMFGDVWEWTASPYLPYPGYRPPAGTVGEYNGKFMCNQMVLRGGSCATPDGHMRATYRNFFYPHQRWQFFGVRLADDA